MTDTTRHKILITQLPWDALKPDTLDLSNSNIVLEATAQVARALQQAPQFRALDLHGNCLAEVGARLLAQALVHVPHLHSLNLADNALGPRGLLALLACVKHVQLRHLDLRTNNIGDEGAMALVHAAAHLGALESLHLADNNITAVDEIAGLLRKKLPTLSVLTLDGAGDAPPVALPPLRKSFQS